MTNCPFPCQTLNPFRKIPVRENMSLLSLIAIRAKVEQDSDFFDSEIQIMEGRSENGSEV